ncbi:MAG: hypothetical protein WC661_12310 [Opitutaceae bacterium]|jgi:hypothetical protein
MKTDDSAIILAARRRAKRDKYRIVYFVVILIAVIACLRFSKKESNERDRVPVVSQEPYKIRQIFYLSASVVLFFGAASFSPILFSSEADRLLIKLSDEKNHGA